ncbi:hypothetical protein B0H15DRAFT_658659 [Mycena belliarum]|uniref:Uncharacterized protein n=1 Tax=Mycena belliarum TaxID=1033014 RepID=A0AAD6TRJ7_9AGAR|nr:hypothetical protein B0H15DRAFT_658659 [Mycena belliae]
MLRRRALPGQGEAARRSADPRHWVQDAPRLSGSRREFVFGSCILPKPRRINCGARRPTARWGPAASRSAASRQAGISVCPVLSVCISAPRLRGVRTAVCCVLYFCIAGLVGLALRPRHGAGVDQGGARVRADGLGFGLNYVAASGVEFIFGAVFLHPMSDSASSIICIFAARAGAARILYTPPS